MVLEKSLAENESLRATLGLIQFQKLLERVNPY